MLMKKAKQEQIDARAEVEAIQADFNAELNEIKAIVNSYNAESEALQDAISLVDKFDEKIVDNGREKHYNKDT